MAPCWSSNYPPLRRAVGHEPAGEVAALLQRVLVRLPLNPKPKPTAYPAPENRCALRLPCCMAGYVPLGELCVVRQADEHYHHFCSVHVLRHVQQAKYM